MTVVGFFIAVVITTSTLVKVSTPSALLPEKPTVSNIIDPVLRAKQEAKEEESVYDPEELVYMSQRVTKSTNVKITQEQKEVSD